MQKKVVNFIKNVKKSFFIIEKIQNTSSAQLCNRESQNRLFSLPTKPVKSQARPVCGFPILAPFFKFYSSRIKKKIRKLVAFLLPTASRWSRGRRATTASGAPASSYPGRPSGAPTGSSSGGSSLTPCTSPRKDSSRIFFAGGGWIGKILLLWDDWKFIFVFWLGKFLLLDD